MNKLEETINMYAVTAFRKEINTSEKRTDFILKNATLEDLVKFYQTKNYKLGDNLGSLLKNGIGETFCHDVLWPKLKNQYIEAITRELLDKTSPDVHITVEFKDRENTQS